MGPSASPWLDPPGLAEGFAVELGIGGSLGETADWVAAAGDPAALGVGAVVLHEATTNTTSAGPRSLLIFASSSRSS
jgi:hypothetical protein